MKNWSENFFARLWRAKKGVPKFLACGGLFFLMGALKTAKKPLILEKSDPKIFFPKNWSVKNILYPPLDDVWGTFMSMKTVYTIYLGSDTITFLKPK